MASGTTEEAGERISRLEEVFMEIVEAREGSPEVKWHECKIMDFVEKPVFESVESQCFEIWEGIRKGASHDRHVCGICSSVSDDCYLQFSDRIPDMGILGWQMRYRDIPCWSAASHSSNMKTLLLIFLHLKKDPIKVLKKPMLLNLIIH